MGECGLVWARRWGFLLLVVAGSVHALLPVYGQKNLRVQTLQTRLATARTASERSRLLSELALFKARAGSDSCFYYVEQALTLARGSRDASAEARALTELAHIYLYVAKDETRALAWLEQARTLATRHADTLNLARCYLLLGVVALHQYDGQPEELFGKGFEYARRTSDWEVQYEIHVVWAEVLARRGDYALAIRYCRQAMELARRHSPDKWLTAGLDLCDLLDKAGRPLEALALARRLDLVKPHLQQWDGPFVYANDLAKLAMRLHQYDEAEAYVLRGIETERCLPRPDTLHLYHYYKTLVDLSARQKHFEKAFTYGTQLTEFRLWIQRFREKKDVKLQLTRLQAALALERKERELAQFAASQQRQRFYLWGALLILLLMGGFIFLLQKKQRHIQRQHAQLVELNQTKDKLFAVLAHDLRSPFTSLSST